MTRVVIGALCTLIVVGECCWVLCKGVRHFLAVVLEVLAGRKFLFQVLLDCCLVPRLGGLGVWESKRAARVSVGSIVGALTKLLLAPEGRSTTGV